MRSDWHVAIGEVDPLTAHGSELYCEESSRNLFLCTRSHDHELPHVATGINGIIVAIWNEDDDVDLWSQVGDEVDD